MGAERAMRRHQLDSGARDSEIFEECRVWDIAHTWGGDRSAAVSSGGEVSGFVDCVCSASATTDAVAVEYELCELATVEVGQDAPGADTVGEGVDYREGVGSGCQLGGEIEVAGPHLDEFLSLGKVVEAAVSGECVAPGVPGR